MAFEKLNFRYLCTFCNSKRRDVQYGTEGGKADRFPLVDEESRVYQVQCDLLNFDDLLDTVRAEAATLLDPCELGDWKLLGCMRENGHSCATTEDEQEISRVNNSIDIYHLNHEPTCKQRHGIAVRLLEDVREAKRVFLMTHQNPAMMGEFQRLAKRIWRTIDRDEPYSGEMIFLLKGQRSNEHPWIQQLLET